MIVHVIVAPPSPVFQYEWIIRPTAVLELIGAAHITDTFTKPEKVQVEKRRCLELLGRLMNSVHDPFPSSQKWPGDTV